MLLASETSIQLTNALEKLIDSGIQLGERVLGALIIFIIGKFLINWLNRLFCTYFGKKKSGPEYPVIPKEYGEYLTAHHADSCCDREIGIELTGFAATSRFCRCCHRYGKEGKRSSSTCWCNRLLHYAYSYWCYVRYHWCCRNNA